MVKRWALAGNDYEQFMETDDCGQYVLHSDYAALEARMTGIISGVQLELEGERKKRFALEARISELEKDAARYRWIRKNCDSLETPNFTLQGWIFVNNGCTKLDCWVDEHLSREA